MVCWCCACCSNGIVAGEPALRKPHCARTCSFPCAFFCWSLFQILFAVLPIGLAAAKIMKIINPEGSWLNLPTSTVHKWCYYNATDTTVLKYDNCIIGNHVRFFHNVLQYSEFAIDGKERRPVHSLAWSCSPPSV